MKKNIVIRNERKGRKEANCRGKEREEEKGRRRERRNRD